MIDEFPTGIVEEALGQAGFDFQQLDIQELWKQIDDLEKKLGLKYVRMDFGVPGLPPPQCARWAQLQAVATGTAPKMYPPAAGLNELKLATSEFLRHFLKLEIDAEYCLPTCGATQGAFIAQAIAGRRYADKTSIVHLEPGYPPVKEQTRFLGFECRGVDMLEHRGTRLVDQLRLHCSSGAVAAISWSSPNNPTGITLSEDELRGIAAVCDQYDIIAIEDAAYLGMNPGSSPPRAKSVAHFTSNFFFLLSASKMFSYAGERIGVLVTSRTLASRSYQNLQRFMGCTDMWQALRRAVFNLTAGAPHSAQLALASAFSSCTHGEYQVVEILAEYGRRARTIKDILLRHRFRLYGGSSEEDGFYLTFAYPGMSAEALLQKLLCHGISALPLALFGGSRNDGLRGCVGLLGAKDLARFERRIEAFSRAQERDADSWPSSLQTNGKER